MVFLSAAAALVAGAAGVAAQTRLADLRIPYNQIPYKVDTTDGPRGIQTGINQCNATTQNQQSMCNTMVVNSIDDFCLWGPPENNSVVADVEGEMVAYCTKATHGTRVIPAGALTGVQFIKTPGYVEVTGHIDQTLIGLQANDTGGEEDPHGADGRGNPIGSLVYSSQFSNQVAGYTQVTEWHNFMGGNIFCIKACDPAGPNAAQLCQHIYDRIGCAYNVPAAYQDGVFESCLGDNQDPPGVYTGADNQVTTYQQPAEELGPITTIPYTARIPASSQCTPFTSSAIYTDGLAFAASSSASASASASSSASTSGVTSAAASGTPVRAAASSSSTTSGASSLYAPSLTLATIMLGLIVARCA